MVKPLLLPGWGINAERLQSGVRILERMERFICLVIKELLVVKESDLDLLREPRQLEPRVSVEHDTSHQRMRCRQRPLLAGGSPW